MLENIGAEPHNVLILLYRAAILIFSFMALVGFFAFRWKEGLWGTILLAFNIMFSALITMNYWEPFGKLLAKLMPFGLFYWDLLVFILLFLLTFLIFNFITKKLSRVIVYTPQLIDNVSHIFLLLFLFSVPINAIIYYAVQIGPVGVGAVADTVAIAENKPIRVTGVPTEAFVTGTAYLASNYSLSHGTPFDPNTFWEQQGNRRFALFTNLWEHGTSLYKGDTKFLEQ